MQAGLYTFGVVHNLVYLHISASTILNMNLDELDKCACVWPFIQSNKYS